MEKIEKFFRQLQEKYNMNYYVRNSMIFFAEFIVKPPIYDIKHNTKLMDPTRPPSKLR